MGTGDPISVGSKSETVQLSIQVDGMMLETHFLLGSSGIWALEDLAFDGASMNLNLKTQFMLAIWQCE
jgi:hypothetical protein